MSDPVKDMHSKLRRTELADAGLCINGRSHGKPTHGVRCAWCAAVHKFGVVAVFASADAPPRPPNHRITRRGGM